MQGEGSQTSWVRDLLHFLAWLVAAALLVIDLAVARGLVMMILVRVGGALSGEDRLRLSIQGAGYGSIATAAGLIATAVLACVGVGLIVWIEYYLRRGAESGRLLRRALKVLMIELGVGAAMQLASVLLSL